MFKNSVSLTIAFIFLSKWVTAADITDKFREEEIIPDIIDDFTFELQPLTVTYPAAGVSVNLGNILRPSQVTIAPEVLWEADAGAFYTLLMTDPDAPSRDNPIRREVRHWLTMNINGSDVNTGDIIFDYRGSGPPVTTGFHRYVFLLFRQASNNLDYDKINGTLSIINTSTRILINEFNLTVVAGDFFRAQFEGVAGLVNDKFRDEEIVPDILDDFTVELQKLNITYTLPGLDVNLGNALTPSQVTDQPQVTWESQAGSFYTLLMTDPDAPSRDAPTLREYRHWLLMNVNGTDLSSGEVIFPYRGSGPPQGTGFHRYVFLLFRQANSNLQYEMDDDNLDRASTNTRNLISTFNLTLVGGDFFQAEYEGTAGTASINIFMLSVVVLAHICVVFQII